MVNKVPISSGGGFYRTWAPLAPLVTCYKAKIVSVEPIVFLLMFGGLMYSLLCEQYYYHYYGSEILRNTSFEFPKGSFCINSSLINNYTGSSNSYKNGVNFSNNLVIYSHLVSKIPAIVVTILLGPITDRYGRRLGIILPSFGMVVQGVLTTVIIYCNINPYYILLANLIAGITGDFTSLIASCFTYIADISSLRWRTFRLAAVEGILSFGKVAGQLTGSYWLNNINCNCLPLMMFYTAITIFMVLYTVFLLPESFTEAKRLKLSSKNKGGVIGIYTQGAKLFFGRLPMLSTWILYVSSASINLAVINVEGAFLISEYFLKAAPFDFSSLQVALYQALRSLTQGVSSLFVVLIFVALSINDAWILLMGYIFNGVCNLLTGFASKTWQLYTISGIQGMEGVVWAAARGIMSKLVKPEHQGALFSIIASTESLMSLLASITWPRVYPFTLQHNMKSGMAFIFISLLGFMIIPFIISILLFKRKPAGVRRDVVESSYHAVTTTRSTDITVTTSSSEDEEY